MQVYNWAVERRTTSRLCSIFVGFCFVVVLMRYMFIPAFVNYLVSRLRVVLMTLAIRHRIR